MYGACCRSLLPPLTPLALPADPAPRTFRGCPCQRLAQSPSVALHCPQNKGDPLAWHSRPGWPSTSFQLCRSWHPHTLRPPELLEAPSAYTHIPSSSIFLVLHPLPRLSSRPSPPVKAPPALKAQLRYHLLHKTAHTEHRIWQKQDIFPSPT